MTTRAGIFGAILLALGAACSGLNARTQTFNTLAEALDAGAVAQGLLPDGLPPGTREIRVGYVPGGSSRWGLFNFPPAEKPVLEQILGDEVRLDGRSIDVPGRIEWWPRTLRGSVTDDTLSTTGLKAYRTRTGPWIVAVNWNQGRGYYWDFK